MDRQQRTQKGDDPDGGISRAHSPLGAPADVTVSVRGRL
jgi:hypothetical protein